MEISGHNGVLRGHKTFQRRSNNMSPEVSSKGILNNDAGHFLLKGANEIMLIVIKSVVLSKSSHRSSFISIISPDRPLRV